MSDTKDNPMEFLLKQLAEAGRLLRQGRKHEADSLIESARAMWRNIQPDGTEGPADTWRELALLLGDPADEEPQGRLARFCSLFAALDGSGKTSADDVEAVLRAAGGDVAGLEAILERTQFTDRGRAGLRMTAKVRRLDRSPNPPDQDWGALAQILDESAVRNWDEIRLLKALSRASEAEQNQDWLAADAAVREALSCWDRCVQDDQSRPSISTFEQFGISRVRLIQMRSRIIGTLCRDDRDNAALAAYRDLSRVPDAGLLVLEAAFRVAGLMTQAERFADAAAILDEVEATLARSAPPPTVLLPRDGTPAASIGWILNMPAPMCEAFPSALALALAMRLDLAETALATDLDCARKQIERVRAQLQAVPETTSVGVDSKVPFSPLVELPELTRTGLELRVHLLSTRAHESDAGASLWAELEKEYQHLMLKAPAGSRDQLAALQGRLRCIALQDPHRAAIEISLAEFMRADDGWEVVGPGFIASMAQDHPETALRVLDALAEVMADPQTIVHNVPEDSPVRPLADVVMRLPAWWKEKRLSARAALLKADVLRLAYRYEDAAKAAFRAIAADPSPLGTLIATLVIAEITLEAPEGNPIAVDFPIEKLEELADTCRQVGSPALECAVQILLAKTLTKAGKVTEALEACRNAQDLLPSAAEDSIRWWVPCLWPWKGFVHATTAACQARAAKAVASTDPEREAKLLEDARQNRRLAAQNATGLFRVGASLTAVLGAIEAGVQPERLDILLRNIRRLAVNTGSENAADCVGQTFAFLQPSTIRDLQIGGRDQEADALQEVSVTPRADLLRKAADVGDVVRTQVNLHFAHGPILAEVPIATPDTAAVHLRIAPDSSRVAVTIWVPDAPVKRVELLLDADANELAEIAFQMQTGLRTGSLESFIQAARRLHQRFWAGPGTEGPEIQSVIGDAGRASIWESLVYHRVKRVLLVPEGRLAEIPFHASYSDTARPLLEDMGITYAPDVESVRLLLNMDPALPEPAFVLADPVGTNQAPIPATVWEANELRDLMPAGTRFVVSEAFTPEQLLQEARDLGWIHVACHAAPAPGGSNWKQAKLFLTPDGLDGDGSLTIQHFLSPSGKARRLQRGATAVLSACTGAGITCSGSLDEPTSLAHAFLHLGCRTVAAATEPVNDVAAAVLMQRFYELRFRESRSTWDALRQAQCDGLSGRLDERFRRLHQEVASAGTRWGDGIEAQTACSHLAQTWLSWILLGL